MASERPQALLAGTCLPSDDEQKIRKALAGHAIALHGADYVYIQRLVALLESERLKTQQSVDYRAIARRVWARIDEKKIAFCYADLVDALREALNG